VVDGDSEGRTLGAITQDDVTKIKSPRGRGKQMNEGAALATGDILLFLHVDTRLPRDALGLIRSAMEDNRHVAGAFDLGIESSQLIFRIIERAASLRSRVTRIPFGDQGIFIRKDYFMQVGGYREIPVMEDVDIMNRIKKQRGRIYIIPRRVSTDSRRWEQEGIVRCTLRNWMLQIFYYLGISPYKLARFYK
jgi:rSAM/selenodomain-associated transferase 2